MANVYTTTVPVDPTPLMNAKHSEATSAASRLCARCGMCCNGVLFYGVKLQATESVKSLGSIGLKIKRKDSLLYCLQPCTAHHNGGCQIYTQRPIRCREFECKQLVAVANAELSESTALEHIDHAHRLADRVSALLKSAGETRSGKAFSTRYAAVFTPPLDTSPDAQKTRAELRSAMEELEAFLNRNFRPLPEASEHDSKLLQGKEDKPF
jgi:uncharacterized protein